MVCSKKATSVLFVRCLIHFPILSHCSTPLHNRRETHRSSLHVYYTHIKSQVFILRVYLYTWLSFFMFLVSILRCGMGCSHIFSQSFFPLHICACTYIHHLIFSSRGGKNPFLHPKSFRSSSKSHSLSWSDEIFGWVSKPFCLFMMCRGGYHAAIVNGIWKL